MAYFAEGPYPGAVHGFAGSTVGVMSEAPSPAARPDSIERIVRRGFELLKTPERFGERLSDEQKRRIGCWLLRLLWKGGDDRFITAQSILDFRNLSYKQTPSYSNAKQWLLPEYAIRRGIVAPDPTILRTLRQIDEAIIQGRQKINQEYAIQGGAVHVRVRTIRDWIAARQRDRLSIYNCYQR
jgi:hypothetical protein